MSGNKEVAYFNDGSLPEVADNALWFASTKDSDTNKAPGFALNDMRYKHTDGTTSYRLFFRYPQLPTSSDRDFPGATATPTRDGTNQPLLEPVLQLQVTTEAPKDTGNYGSNLANNSTLVNDTRWLSKASETNFNLIVAAGDTPARVGSATYEINGGLHNFVRFLENWSGVNANINGSFIQFKRSIYASAPFQALVRPGPTTAPSNLTSIFIRTLNSDRPGYTSASTSIGTKPAGEAPYYMPPNRNWGFDVALLAQNPDLFAQRFVIPATDPPNEYYREVGRDDLWVQTLLCAVQTQTADGFDTADSTYFGSGLKFALPATERPGNGECKLKPS